METGGNTTKTVRFDLEILGRDDGGRCCADDAAFGVTSGVWPPQGLMGGVAGTAHTGDGTGGWNQG